MFIIFVQKKKKVIYFTTVFNLFSSGSMSWSKYNNLPDIAIFFNIYYWSTVLIYKYLCLYLTLLNMSLTLYTYNIIVYLQQLETGCFYTNLSFSFSLVVNQTNIQNLHPERHLLISNKCRHFSNMFYISYITHFPFIIRPSEWAAAWNNNIFEYAYKPINLWS